MRCSIIRADVRTVPREARRQPQGPELREPFARRRFREKGRFRQQRLRRRPAGGRPEGVEAARPAAPQARHALHDGRLLRRRLGGGEGGPRGERHRRGTPRLSAPVRGRVFRRRARGHRRGGLPARLLPAFRAQGPHRRGVDRRVLLQWRDARQPQADARRRAGERHRQGHAGRGPARHRPDLAAERDARAAANGDRIREVGAPRDRGADGAGVPGAGLPHGAADPRRHGAGRLDRQDPEAHRADLHLRHGGLPVARHPHRAQPRVGEGQDRLEEDGRPDVRGDLAVRPLPVRRHGGHARRGPLRPRPLPPRPALADARDPVLVRLRRQGGAGALRRDGLQARRVVRLGARGA